jgi:hypothetical protein
MVERTIVADHYMFVGNDGRLQRPAGRGLPALRVIVSGGG